MENTNTNSTSNAPASALPQVKTGATFPLPLQVCELFQALQSDKDKAQFVNALFVYILDGKETPQESLAVATFFEMARKQIDFLKLKNARISEKRRASGDLGRETLRKQRELAKRLAQASTPAKVEPSTPAKVDDKPPAKAVAQDPVAKVEKLLDQKEAQKVYLQNYMRKKRKDPKFREKENAKKRARYAKAKAQAKHAGK